MNFNIGATKSYTFEFITDRQEAVDDIMRTGIPLPTDLVHIAVDYLKANMIDDHDWKKYLSIDVPKPPPIKKNIQRKLQECSPYFSGKKLGEVLTLLYIPQNISGQPLTSRLLVELKQKEFDCSVKLIEQYLSNQYISIIQKSYWLLIANECHSVSKPNFQRVFRNMIQGMPPAYRAAKPLEIIIYNLFAKAIYPDQKLDYSFIDFNLSNSKFGCGITKGKISFIRIINKKKNYKSIRIRYTLMENSKKKNDSWVLVH